MRQSIFDYASEGAHEYLLVEPNIDGGAEIKVHSVGGGLASIDLPPDQVAELGRKLLALAGAS